MNDEREHSKASGTPDRPNEISPVVSHEPNVVDTRPIAEFGIGLFILLVLTGVLMWGVFRHFAVREEMSEPPPSQLTKSPEQRLPPEPRLQGLPGHPVQPFRELMELREAEDAVLNSYGWVDQQSRIVRIPIKQAIKLITERGLPYSEAGKPDAGTGRHGDAGKDRHGDTATRGRGEETGIQ